MEMDNKTIIQTKMFAIDAVLRCRNMNNTSLPVTIDTSVIPKNDFGSLEDVMKLMNTSGYIVEADNKDYIDTIVGDAKRIYNWIKE